MCIAHASLPHALTRAIDQRCQIIALHTAYRQELFLHRDPFRHIQLSQCLPFDNAVQCGAHLQPLNEARGTGLHDGLVAFIESDTADH